MAAPAALSAPLAPAAPAGLSAPLAPAAPAAPAAAHGENGLLPLLHGA
ncbi:MAG: hypothetical protein LBD25_07480 [Coriobacteriales bacterium]|nr:hypothetical protein [Coriobacteriales bacterium]